MPSDFLGSKAAARVLGTLEQARLKNFVGNLVARLGRIAVRVGFKSPVAHAPSASISLNA